MLGALVVIGAGRISFGDALVERVDRPVDLGPVHLADRVMHVGATRAVVGGVAEMLAVDPYLRGVGRGFLGQRKGVADLAEFNGGFRVHGHALGLTMVIFHAVDWHNSLTSVFESIWPGSNSTLSVTRSTR